MPYKKPYTDEQKRKMSERTKAWGEKNREKINARRRGKNHKRPGRLETLRQVNELRSVPCVDCGGSFPTCCMDFDHLPEHPKVDAVLAMVVSGRPRALIMEEIAKCEVVCSNCHRVRTRDRRAGKVQNNGRNFIDKLEAIK